MRFAGAGPAVLVVLSSMAGLSAEEDRSSVAELRAAGVEAYKARKYFQAIQNLEAALAAAPAAEKAAIAELLARARSALGVELFNEGETRKAEECFREALRHAPDSYAHFGLGFIHFLRVEDDSAREHLARALSLERGYAKTHKLLGLLDYRLGRTPEAIEKMKEAVRLDPKDAEARALLDRWVTEGEFTGSFVERVSGAFRVRSDPELPPERVEEVLRRLEAARERVSSGLGLDAKAGRTSVVLFAEERFQKATRSLHWVAGVYDGQIKLPVPRAKPRTPEDARALDESLRHELAHLAVRQVSPECPNWLNEGIAQRFEGKERGDETRKLLRAGASRKIAFRNVPARLWEVEDEALARWTYLQGLGFVDYLCERFLEFRLRLLLDALAKERSLGAAFEATYGITLEAAEAAWWRDIESKP